MTFFDASRNHQAHVEELLDGLRADSRISESKKAPLIAHLKFLGDNAEALNKVLDGYCSASNQPTLLFTLRMPFRLHRHADLGKRLGFLTQEEALSLREKRASPSVSRKARSGRSGHPEQEAVSLEIPFPLALAMGLVKIIQITLTPQDPAKIHPNYGTKYTTFEVYSLSLKFCDIRDDILGVSIDLAFNPDGVTPDETFRYQIVEASEDYDSQNNLFPLNESLTG